LFAAAAAPSYCVRFFRRADLFFSNHPAAFFWQPLRAVTIRQTPQAAEYPQFTKLTRRLRR